MLSSNAEGRAEFDIRGKFDEAEENFARASERNTDDAEEGFLSRATITFITWLVVSCLVLCYNKG